MAWTAPMTAVAGSIFLAADFNSYIRDNLLECAPAKASVAGSYFATSDLNQLTERKAQQAFVNQPVNITSTSYADPASSLSGDPVIPGPALTMITGSVALVTVGGRIGGGSSATQSVKMSWACSGSTTIAATDTQAAGEVGWASGGFAYCSRAWLATGLVPGSNTFTAKYAVSSGTALVSARTLTVMPF